MITNHEGTIKLEGLQLSVAGAPPVAATLTMCSMATGGTVFTLRIGRKNHQIAIEELDLVKHIGFSLGRSARDAAIGGRYIP